MEETMARTMKAEIGVAAEQGPIEVTFTKKDGTERIMKCTLKEEFIPVEHRPKQDSDRKPNPETMAVWDMVKNTRTLLTE